MALDELNSRIKEQQRLERECVEVDDDIAVLRNAYEQYFMGLERKPPVLKHDALKRRLLKLRNSAVRNTVLKFRIGTLEQKLKTYERMWDRTLKEMENGTYRRDLAKLRRKKEEAARAGAAPAEPARPTEAITQVPPTAPGPVQTTVPVRPGTPAQPSQAARPVTPPAGANGMSDAKVKAIYDAYVVAKRQCQEDTSKLTLDAMASTLRKQVPELLKRHNAKEIDFKIVIKDGKAVLRAVPK